MYVLSVSGFVQRPTGVQHQEDGGGFCHARSYVGAFVHLLLSVEELRLRIRGGV